jgi:hypothetical protein
MDDIQIQLQDLSGNWRTFSITLNNSQMILQEMHSLADRYPGQRVRAVDNNGRVVDIL